MTGPSFTWTADGVRALYAHPDSGPQRAEKLLEDAAEGIRQGRAHEPLRVALTTPGPAPEPYLPGEPGCSYCGQDGSQGPLVYDGLQPQGWNTPAPGAAPSYAGYDPARAASTWLRWHDESRLPHPVSLAEARDRELLGKLGAQDWQCQDTAACVARHNREYPPVPLTVPGCLTELAGQAEVARADEVALTAVLHELKAGARDEMLALTAASSPPSFPVTPAGITLGEMRRWLPLAGHHPMHLARLAAGLPPPPPEEPQPVPEKRVEPSPRRGRARTRATLKGGMRKR